MVIIISVRLVLLLLLMRTHSRTASRVGFIRMIFPIYIFITIIFIFINDVRLMLLLLIVCAPARGIRD